MKYEKNVLLESGISDILKRDGKISLIIAREELKALFDFCILNDINFEFVDICSEYNDIYYVCIDEDLYIEPLFMYDTSKEDIFIPLIDVDKIHLSIRMKNKNEFNIIIKEFASRNIEIEYI